MATIGDIVIGLRMNHSQFSAGAQAVRSEVGGLGSIASAVGGKLLGLAVAATAGMTVIGAARWGIEVAAQGEMAQASFASLLGSASVAKSMLGDLTQYAAKTPYSQGGVRDAAQTLLNFGVNARDVIPDLKMLGDVAMGSEEKLGRISLAYGQISSTGRLMGQDLMQLINAGFNPLQEISHKTGESMSELKKRMEDGKISFAEVRGAFESATSEGGRFHDMAAKQSTTLTGLWSTLKDEVGLTLGAIMAELMGSFDLKSLLGETISFISGLRQGIEDFKPLLTGFGMIARNVFDVLMLPLRAIYETLGAIKAGYQWIADQPASGVDAAAAGNDDFKSNGAIIRRREEAQAAISRKNREDPFGFAGNGGDLKKWTDALNKHSEVMGKTLAKQGTREQPGLHGGIGGMFFDDKGGDYVGGGAQQVADWQKTQANKDWEDGSKGRDRERRASQRGAGAITAGSSEFFKTLFAAGGNQQADRAFRVSEKQLRAALDAANGVAGLRRDFQNNQIAAVGVR